jgi:hypothetical protein
MSDIMEDTAYLRNTLSLMSADDYKEQQGIPIPPHIQQWRKMSLLEKLEAENANLIRQVQALHYQQQLVEIGDTRLLELEGIIQEQRAKVALLKKEIKRLEASKDLPSNEFPPESTLESMQCQAPDELDDHNKHALLQSENADLWKPYFPSVENDDDEIERYKNENAQLLEQAVAMFQTAWCVDLVQDNLDQNILISENLAKEIAELNREYVNSVCNACARAREKCM